jgi:hypothetical protein
MAYLRTFLTIASLVVIINFISGASLKKDSRAFEDNITYSGAASKDFIPITLKPVPSCGTFQVKIEPRIVKILSIGVRVSTAIDQRTLNNTSVISIYLMQGVLQI